MVSAWWLVVIAIASGCGGLMLGAMLIVGSDERQRREEFEDFERRRRARNAEHR